MAPPVNFSEGTYGFFADMDYDDLSFLIQQKPLRCRMIYYYSQQCVEKYLKQVAREDGMSSTDSIMQGHNLVRVAKAVDYPNADKYREELLSLGKLYFEGRYPNEDKAYMFVEPTPSEVKKAIEVVEDVRSWVLSVLNITKDVATDTLHKWNFIDNE